MMMDENKRRVDTYEVKYAIHVGDKEILFAVDEKKADCPYMVCNCTWDNPLGLEQYSNAAGSADYLETMTEFNSRVTAQLEAAKAERDRITVPLEPFAIEHCIPKGNSQSYENKVVILHPDCLRPEYRTADKQLLLATGGFGTYANSRGRAVYTVNIYSGRESRWNREDILSILKPEYMPEWAKERLKHIQAERQMNQKKHQPER